MVLTSCGELIAMLTLETYTSITVLHDVELFRWNAKIFVLAHVPINLCGWPFDYADGDHEKLSNPRDFKTTISSPKSNTRNAWDIGEAYSDTLIDFQVVWFRVLIFLLRFLVVYIVSKCARKLHTVDVVWFEEDQKMKAKTTRDHTRHLRVIQLLIYDCTEWVQISTHVHYKAVWLVTFNFDGHESSLYAGLKAYSHHSYRWRVRGWDVNLKVCAKFSRRREAELAKNWISMPLVSPLHKNFQGGLLR